MSKSSTPAVETSAQDPAVEGSKVSPLAQSDLVSQSTDSRPRSFSMGNQGPPPASFGNYKWKKYQMQHVSES